MFHNKADMSAHLAKHPELNQNEIARHHGWDLIDCVCSCGAEFNKHLVDSKASIEADLRVRACLKCGARGTWKHSPSKPQAKVVEKPKEEVKEVKHESAFKSLLKKLVQ